MNYYELLKINPQAATNQIREAYYREKLALQLLINNKQTTVPIAVLTEAYNVLKDPLSKQRYDEYLYRLANNTKDKDRASSSSQQKYKIHRRDGIMQTTVDWSKYPWRDNDYSNVEETVMIVKHPLTRKKEKNISFSHSTLKYLFSIYSPILLLFILSINHWSKFSIENVLPLMILSNVAVMVSWSIFKGKSISWLFNIINVFYSCFITFCLSIITFNHSEISSLFMFLFFLLIIYWAKKISPMGIVQRSIKHQS